MGERRSRIKAFAEKAQPVADYINYTDLGDVDENNHFTSLGKVLDQLSLRQCKRWSQRTRIHRFHQRPQLAVKGADPMEQED